MSTRSRFYLCEADQPVRRIPRRFVEHGFPAEWRGRRLRVAHVAVELEERRPVAIRDLSGGYLNVDADGLVVWDAMLDLEDGDRMARERRKRVPDLAAMRALKEQQASRRFDVSEAEAAAIRADVFGSGEPEPVA